MRKELFINSNNETYIDYLLSGILREARYPWFYERYINLCVLSNSKSNFSIEFLEVMNAACECFYTKRVLSNLQKNENNVELRKKIAQAIDEDYYVALWVDEYYIPNTESYSAYHRIHPIFVYGYDTKDSIFLFLQYSPTKGMIKLQINSDSLYLAFMGLSNATISDQDVLAPNLLLQGYLEQKSDLKHKFQLKQFLQELQNYITSDNHTSNHVVGIKIYDYFIQAIHNDYKISFRSVLVLYIHKQFMQERFLYISNNFKTSDNYIRLIRDYETIVSLCKHVLFLTIKYNMRDNYYEGDFSKNSDFRKKVVNILRELRERETHLLNQIYSELTMLTN